jgi:hypothetical protein
MAVNVLVDTPDMFAQEIIQHQRGFVFRETHRFRLSKKISQTFTQVHKMAPNVLHLSRKHQNATVEILLMLALVACVSGPRPGTPIAPPLVLPTTSPTATIVAGPTSQLPSTVSATPTITEQPSTVMIPFKTVAQEAPLGDHPTAPLYTVVSRPSEWDELREVLPTRAINPGIQASKLGDSLIVVAFAGRKGSSGYSIVIENISKQGNQIAAVVSQTTPGPNEYVTDAATVPYHLVALSKKDFLPESTLTFVFYDKQGAVLAKKDVTLP